MTTEPFDSDAYDRRMRRMRAEVERDLPTEFRRRNKVSLNYGRAAPKQRGNGRWGVVRRIQGRDVFLTFDTETEAQAWLDGRRQ